jgi:hypothetical protein
MHTTWSDWFVNHESNVADNRTSKHLATVSVLEIWMQRNYEHWLKKLTRCFSCRCKQKHHDSTFPQELWRNKNPPRQQSLLHAEFGTQAICILIDLKTALTNCNIIVPMVQELSECETAQDSNIPVPEITGMVGVKGSAIFIPRPVLRNTILMSNTKDPFELITLMTRKARAFDLAQTKRSTILEGDDLNAWLYG